MTHHGGLKTQLRLRGTDLHWQAIDGELVALEAQGSHYLAANEAGTLLWQALAAGSTREALATKLATAYGVPHSRALADTDAFLEQLRSQGLLEE